MYSDVTTDVELCWKKSNTCVHALLNGKNMSRNFKCTFSRAYRAVYWIVWEEESSLTNFFCTTPLQYSSFSFWFSWACQSIVYIDFLPYLLLFEFAIHNIIPFSSVHDVIALAALSDDYIFGIFARQLAEP